jgi:hypothetical protein
MKAFPLAHPFSKFVGYNQTIRGRNYIYMWNRSSDKRSLISKARYELSVKEGRVLTKEEEADHVDNNPLNDLNSNLQILSPADNKRKQKLAKNGRILSHTDQKCSICNSVFRFYKIKQTCSKPCLSKLKSKKQKSFIKGK